MITRREVSAGLVSAAVLAGTSADAISETAVMQLRAPKMSGGMPLMQALKLRHSAREYSERPLPLPVLSDLLWAAFGVNRASGDRTVPYWRHIMVIDVYAAMTDGVWLYDPKAHLLRKHLNADIRAGTGQQDFVGSAPLNLVYVAHGERMHDVPPEDRRLYASVDAGFCGQNVYLFCASEGLASVFRAAIDYKKLAKAMQLEGEQFVTFAQTVGYPRS
jgi:Nitroreductase family